MLSRDYKEVFGGLLLVCVGTAFAWHSMIRYDLGSLRHMGPGMFPMGLGILLAFYGSVQLIPALFRRGTFPQFRIWTPIFVLSGVSAFALMVNPFGLIPAIVAVVVISSLAELKIRPVSLIALCAGLCLMVWLVFRVGFGLLIPMFRWPF